MSWRRCGTRAGRGLHLGHNAVGPIAGQVGLGVEDVAKVSSATVRRDASAAEMHHGGNQTRPRLGRKHGRSAESKRPWRLPMGTTPTRIRLTFRAADPEVPQDSGRAGQSRRPSARPSCVPRGLPCAAASMLSGCARPCECKAARVACRCVLGIRMGIRNIRRSAPELQDFRNLQFIMTI